MDWENLLKAKSNGIRNSNTNFKKYPKPEGVSATKNWFYVAAETKTKMVDTPHRLRPHDFSRLPHAVANKGSMARGFPPLPDQDNKKQWQPDPPKNWVIQDDVLLGSVPHKCLHHCFYRSAILGVDPTGCCHFPEILLHSFWSGLAGMGLAGLGSAGFPLAGLGAFCVPCPQSPH